MNNQEHTSPLTGGIEAVSSAVLPISGSFAAVHELNAQGYIQAPFVEQIPGIEHSSSAAGGAVVGMLGGVISERVATHFEAKGYEKSAERARRFGAAITLIGSLATQITLESALIKGTPDTLDVIVGMAFTIPGIIAGQKKGEKSQK